MPSWLKAALITSAQTFVASAIVTLLGLLSSLQDWVSGSGAPPDWSNAAKLIGSALVAAVAGVLTAVYRAIHPPEVTYPDPPPAP